MKLKISKEDCKKEDLKIPKGYRLIKDYELLKEIREGNKKLEKLAKEKWIWVDNGKNIRAAGFYYGNDVFHIDGYYGINPPGCSRGVFVKGR